MSPSCGLLHGWGFVFIWPGSAARPENPQTAGCCSCAPSVLRGPSSFASTLLLRGYPRMDNQPTDSAQNRQLVQFFRHAAFADDAAFWLALSEILSAQSFCQSPPPPPERAGPLPRRQEGPGWGLSAAGAQIFTFMESGVGNIPVLITGHIQSDWHSLSASALCGTASRHQPFSSPPFSKTSCTPFETTA